MRSSRLLLTGFGLGALLLAACGSDDLPDVGGFVDLDARVVLDSGVSDTGPEDSGAPDAGPGDTGALDAAPEDTGTPDTGPADAGMLDPDAQLAAIRGLVGMIDPAIRVPEAWVTAVRPQLGADPAGFFVQASRLGPALFVAIDPASLTPAPAVGDAVRFDVAETAEADRQHRVVSIAGFSVLGSGNDVTALVQDLSAATDVVDALSSYESELVTVAGTLTGTYRASGPLHQRIQLATAGLPTEPDLQLRTLETLVSSLGLQPGCDVQIGPTPLWRFADAAQPSAWSAGDIQVTACANPTRLVSASAIGNTSVTLTFDRPLDPATVTPAQFSLQPAAAIMQAQVSANTVTLLTAPLAELVTYEVTVGSAVTDDLGGAIDPSANTARFAVAGAATPPSAAGDLVITEILQAPVSPGVEWFEVHNPGATALDLAGCIIRDDGSNSFTVPSGIYVQAGGYATFAATGTPGFVPTHVWTSFSLGNNTDEVVIVCGGTEIDRVDYDGGPYFPDPTGASMSLAAGVYTSAVANDDGRSWCVSTTSFPGGLGTPGAVNDPCTSNPPNAPRPSAAGQLVITEIMKDPAGADAGQEWFELYNPSGSVTYNLFGCELHDLDPTAPDLAVARQDVLVGPGAYVTVGTGIDRVGSHGFAVDLMLDDADFGFGNGADEVVLSCFGAEIDRVAYDDTSFPDISGVALSLEPTTADAVSNDLGASWCPASAVYDGTNLGTPGAVNSSCTGPPDAGVADSGAVDAGAMDAGVADAGDAGPTDAGGGTPRFGLVINEVDYDQTGSDTMEFIELYNSSAVPIDLTGSAVVAINGNGGAEVWRELLSGTLAPGGYIVLGNVGVTVPGGVPFITLSSNSLQNGAPDGVAVIDTTGNTLIDALSYEGSITAASIGGFANPVSLVEGTALVAIDNGAMSLARVPNGRDTDDANSDFVASGTPTPGTANVP